MRRSYRKDRYLGIIERVRTAMPDASITTDIIVGFPGETEADLEETIDVIREARFSNAFTFQYSQRPGTPAATMPDQVPAEVVGERYKRLLAVAEEVAEGEGRKDEHTHRLSGRAADNRLVHVAAVDVRPGDMVTARVTYAAPHHLVADEVVGVLRTRAGDAWEARQASPSASGVLLGMPVIGVRS
jgi:tRNA-2-methylthio-N6-dimethylallyladenosine synthase